MVANGRVQLNCDFPLDNIAFSTPQWLVVTGRVFKPKLWLWWRIRAARKRVKQANAQLEAVDLDSVLSEGQRRIDDLGLREDELKLLLQQKLIFAARRWGVFVPHCAASWPKQAYKGRALASEAEHSVSEQLFQGRLTMFAIVVGLSSVVQAIYAVLSYHRRH